MTEDEKAVLADVYERAAEYLEKYGWKRGSAGEEGRPRCFIGATASAIGEIKIDNFIVSDPVLWHKANCFAAKTLELPSHTSIMDWNDDPDRTADEVINTLHALANKLR